MEEETGHVGEKTGRTDEVETGVNTGREEREEREVVTVGGRGGGSSRGGSSEYKSRGFSVLLDFISIF